MKTFLALASLLLCGACATMVNGRMQTIDVDSYPSGALVAVNCGDATGHGGMTPVSITVPRRAPACILTLTKSGYETRQLRLERQESKATRVNAAFGVPVAAITGLIGVVIGDAFDSASEVGSVGASAGMELGSAPARQLDKHTGGAYKWVPGRIFVTLVRE